MSAMRSTRSSAAETFSFYDPDFARDPWCQYDRLREEGPVSWLSREKCFLLLDYEVVKAALADPVFTVDHPFRASRILLGGPTILDLEGEEHDRLRAPLGRGFAKRVIDAEVDLLVDGILSGFLTRFEQEGRIDLVPDFAEVLPIAVTCALLGFGGVAPREVYDTLRPITRFLDNPREGQAEALRTRDRLMAQIRRAGSSAAETCVLAQMFRDARDTEEAVRMVLLTLVGGSETSACVIANLIYLLREDPTRVATLRADPEKAADYVLETVRWESPTALTVRFAAQDTEVAGLSIRRGSTVILSIAAANRDPAVFRDPHRWNPDRGPASLISFGRGRHACPGYYLARQEIVRALRFVVDHWSRFDWGDPPFPQADGIHGRTFRMPRALPARLVPCRHEGAHA